RHFRRRPLPDPAAPTPSGRTEATCRSSCGACPCDAGARLLPSGAREPGAAMAPGHLSVREMREDERPLVLEMLKAGVKDTENRVALHALTRPPALLLLAAASSGLRFVLASFALALLLPVFLAVAAMKLGLRARWGSLPPPGLSPGERGGEEESGPALWGRTCGRGTPSRDEAILGVGRGLLTARSGSAEPLQRRVAYPEGGPGQDRVGTGLPTPGPSPEGEPRGAARPIWFFAPDC
ncbi:unnamed protein product, partial [Gulo gulo]